MVLSAILLWAALTSAAPTQSPMPTREVNGVLLLTADAKVYIQAKRDWHMGESYIDFAKHFTADRFLVKEWAKQSAIVIDLRSGPLGNGRALADSSKALLSLVRSDGTIDVKDRDKIAGIPLGTPPDGSTDGALGLYADLTVSVNSGGVSKSFIVPIKNDATDARDNALHKHPLVPPKKDGGNSPGGTKAAEPTIDSPPDRASIYLLGFATGHFADGMREASKLVDELQRALDDENAQTDLQLLNKLGLNGASIAAGEIPLSDLPSKIKDNLTRDFAGSWNGLGFSSQADAESFLQNSKSVQVSTHLGLKFCISLADPSHHDPGSSGVIIFGSVKGGIGP
jgi:hypothetical protein